MITALDGRPQSAELERDIKERVTQRVGRRVRALKVELRNNRAVTRGCISSYYLKQATLQAVLDVVGPAGANEVEFNGQWPGPIRGKWRSRAD